MTMPIRCARALGAALVLSCCAVFAATPAWAQVTAWANAGTGSWFTAGNWSAGVPNGGGTNVAVGNGGTAQIDGAGAAVAGGGLQVSGGSTVDLQAGSSLTVGGVFGTVLGDSVSKGTLLLSGSTNYTGSILLQGGELASNVTGTLNGALVLATDFGFGNLVSAAAGQTLTLAGTVSSFFPGTSIVIGGPGTVVFTGSNTYSGTTTINSGGTLQLGAGGTTGTAGTVGIVDNGTLAIARSNAFSPTNAISGNGGLTLAANNTGTVTLLGTNTYNGTTDVQGGTLVFDGATTHLSATSTINVGSGGTVKFSSNSFSPKNLTGAGVVIIDQSDSIPPITLKLTNGNFTGTISEVNAAPSVGGQKVQQLTGGTTILAGTNSWTGGTTIDAGGTLIFGNGGTTGTLPTTGAIVDNGTLGFNHSDNVTFAGSFSGSGGLIQMGSGTLFLTGVNTFTGITAINAGVLSVNGSTAGSVTVNNGGTLKGNGTVGGFTANSGGTVAPGNSIGTLNVAGNASFASGSIYQVEVDSAGNSDKIVATGTATIATGATANVVAAAGTYAPSTSYTILTAAGGVTGNFSTVTSNFAFLTPTTTNTGNSVVLTLGNVPVVTFPSVAVTPNQIASSTALQALGSGSLYNAVLVSSTANALAAFDASSGEIHATLLASQFEAANNARRTVLERMRRQTRDEGWSVWGSVGGDWGNLGSNGNAASANRNGVDVSVGADGSLDDHWRGGIEGGYNGGNINIADRASHAHLTGGHVGAYAWGNYGDYVLRTGFSWGFGTAHTSRAISFAGFADAATASENTKTVLLYGEAGYDIHLQDVTLEPYMGLAWTQLNAGSFRETGGAAALSGASKDMDNGYFSVGLNANTRAYSLGGSTTIAPLARIAWQHGFNSITASRSLAFIAGGPSFTVLGTPLDGDRALLDIGATLAVSAATEFSLGYYGALGGRANDHAVKLLGAMHL